MDVNTIMWVPSEETHQHLIGTEEGAMQPKKDWKLLIVHQKLQSTKE